MAAEAKLRKLTHHYAELEGRKKDLDKMQRHMSSKSMRVFPDLALTTHMLTRGGLWMPRVDVSAHPIGHVAVDVGECSYVRAEETDTVYRRGFAPMVAPRRCGRQGG